MYRKDRDEPCVGVASPIWDGHTKAVFDLTESRFRFIVNPDSDSVANRMVWIRERGRV